MHIPVTTTWRTTAMSLGAAALLALPLAAIGQNYHDPVIPDLEQQPDRGQGGSSGGYTPPDHNTDPLAQGELLDSTETIVTSTREAKALEFESDASRITGNGIDYDPGLDSAEGGGADGGFPYWEASGDWAVTESASCKVAGRNKMTKVAGTKEQSLSCYVDWMNGSRQYVDLSHCEAGANNVKPAGTKSYLPSSCPHPEWVFGNWGSWYNTSGWYRASAHRGKKCGTITEYIRQARTRSVSCKNGSYQECKIYNGPAKTTDTRRVSRQRYLGACSTSRFDGGNYVALHAYYDCAYWYYYPLPWVQFVWDGKVVATKVVGDHYHPNTLKVRSGPYSSNSRFSLTNIDYTPYSATLCGYTSKAAIRRN